MTQIGEGVRSRRSSTGGAVENESGGESGTPIVCSRA